MSESSGLPLLKVFTIFTGLNTSMDTTDACNVILLGVWVGLFCVDYCSYTKIVVRIREH